MKAGLPRTALWKWANQFNPRIDALEAVLNAVGLRIRIEEIPE